MSTAAAKRLEGKTVVITGASSGIGRSCAFEFARAAPQNLRLILTARRLDKLHEVAAEINNEVGGGVQVLPVSLDISKPDEVRSFVPRLPEEWRDINILVNNAYTPRLSADPRTLVLTGYQRLSQGGSQGARDRRRRHQHHV